VSLTHGHARLTLLRDELLDLRPLRGRQRVELQRRAEEPGPVAAGVMLLTLLPLRLRVLREGDSGGDQGEGCGERRKRDELLDPAVHGVLSTSVSETWRAA